jgi:hypothetical protein
METLEIEKKRKNIIEWIYSIDNQETLLILEKIKNQEDFEQHYSNAISEEEFEKQTTDFINSLSWEK